MTKKDTRTMLHSESTSSLQNLDFIEDWDLSDVVDLNASKVPLGRPADAYFV